MCASVFFSLWEEGRWGGVKSSDGPIIHSSYELL